MENKIFDEIEIETIEKLAKIVSDNELSEIAINISGYNIKIKGKKVPPIMPAPMGITSGKNF